jgi:hypothetical protein
VIEHHAGREQVAARVVADEADLLGRHVGRGPHRQLELLLEQVGKQVVPRQAEVDQHRPSPSLPSGSRRSMTVARLDVEVDDALPVQVVQRRRDPGAELRDLVDGQRRGVEALAQRAALDPLHDDVRAGG